MLANTDYVVGNLVGAGQHGQVYEVIRESDVSFAAKIELVEESTPLPPANRSNWKSAMNFNVLEFLG